MRQLQASSRSRHPASEDSRHASAWRPAFCACTSRSPTEQLNELNESSSVLEHLSALPNGGGVVESVSEPDVEAQSHSIVSANALASTTMSGEDSMVQDLASSFSDEQNEFYRVLTAEDGSQTLLTVPPSVTVLQLGPVTHEIAKCNLHTLSQGVGSSAGAQMDMLPFPDDVVHASDLQLDDELVGDLEERGTISQGVAAAFEKNAVDEEGTASSSLGDLDAFLDAPHARLRCTSPQLGSSPRGCALEHGRARYRLEVHRRLGECRQTPPVMCACVRSRTAPCFQPLCCQGLLAYNPLRLQSSLFFSCGAARK